MKLRVDQQTRQVLSIYNLNFPEDKTVINQVSVNPASDNSVRVANMYGIREKNGLLDRIGQSLGVLKEHEHVEITDPNFNYLTNLSDIKFNEGEEQVLRDAVAFCMEYEDGKRGRFFGSQYNATEIESHRYLIGVLIRETIKEIIAAKTPAEKQKLTDQLIAFCNDIIAYNNGELCKTRTTDQSSIISMQENIIRVRNELEQYNLHLDGLIRADELTNAFKNTSLYGLIESSDRYFCSLMLSAPFPNVGFSDLLNIIDVQNDTSDKHVKAEIKPTTDKTPHKEEKKLIDSDEHYWFIVQCFLKPLAALKRFEKDPNTIIDENDFPKITTDMLKSFNLGPDPKKNAFDEETMKLIKDCLDTRNRLIKISMALSKIKLLISQTGELAKFFAHEEIKALVEESQATLNKLDKNRTDLEAAMQKYHTQHPSTAGTQWHQNLLSSLKLSSQIRSEIKLQIDNLQAINTANTKVKMYSTIDHVKQILLDINKFLNRQLGLHPKKDPIVEQVLNTMAKTAPQLTDVQEYQASMQNINTSTTEIGASLKNLADAFHTYSDRYITYNNNHRSLFSSHGSIGESRAQSNKSLWDHKYQKQFLEILKAQENIMLNKNLTVQSEDDLKKNQKDFVLNTLDALIELAKANLLNLDTDKQTKRIVSGNYKKHSYKAYLLGYIHKLEEIKKECTTKNDIDFTQLDKMLPDSPSSKDSAFKFFKNDIQNTEIENTVRQRYTREKDENRELNQSRKAALTHISNKYSKAKV